MDIFGLKPLSELLVLVVCQRCQRPVKASRFLQHNGRLSLLIARKVPTTASITHSVGKFQTQSHGEQPRLKQATKADTPASSQEVDAESRNNSSSVIRCSSPFRPKQAVALSRDLQSVMQERIDTLFAPKRRASLLEFVYKDSDFALLLSHVKKSQPKPMQPRPYQRKNMLRSLYASLAPAKNVLNTSSKKTKTAPKKDTPKSLSGKQAPKVACCRL